MKLFDWIKENDPRQTQKNWEAERRQGKTKYIVSTCAIFTMGYPLLGIISTNPDVVTINYILIEIAKGLVIGLVVGLVVWNIREKNRKDSSNKD